MRNYSVKYSNKKGNLNVVFGGQLTISNIEKITEELNANRKKHKSIDISTENVENIDVTFVQLLYALKLSGQKEGFDVSISISVPDDLKSLLTNAGFSGIICKNN
ncbi:MAG: STAS domain-containing protein [Cytophagaceae bacterium]|jgi:ABC-type transporter Mla MlaB component|nr:STAS domain-containing protein [Cytophagaceae bacterium]